MYAPLDLSAVASVIAAGNARKAQEVAREAVMDKSQQAYAEWYRENCGQPHDLRVIWDAAWQASRKQALKEAQDAMFDIKGDKEVRFDAWSAIRNLNEEPK